MQHTIIHAVSEGLHLRLVEVVWLQCPVHLALLPRHLGQHLLVLLGGLDRRWLVLAMEVFGDNEGESNAGAPGSGGASYPVCVGRS